MESLLMIFPVVFLIACAFCATQESKALAPYKYFNAFGRVKAYLAMDFTMAGLFLYLASIVSAFVSISRETPLFIGTIGCALLFGIGLFLYYDAYCKCPDFLKKKVIKDMVIVGLGVAMKICLFFIPAIWKVATYQGPATITTQYINGKAVGGYITDTYGARHTVQVNSSGTQYKDEKGEWHDIK